MGAWERIREKFSDEEKKLINEAPRAGESICPKGVFFDEDALPENLFVKLMQELSDGH